MGLVDRSLAPTPALEHQRKCKKMSSVLLTSVTELFRGLLNKNSGVALDGCN